MLFARSSFDDVLGDLTAGRLLAGDVTGHFVRPATSARFGEFPADLHPDLVRALAARGIARPYTHQEAAIAHARAGRNVVLATPTASGKTLCFNVPVLDRALREPDARALYIFPTKALAQDQYAGLHELVEAAGADIKTYTFDGDTPEDARRAVRDHGQIVITNPDMLHAAILPQHTKWTKLFENLKWVIIDELHSYRGVFGSNIAHLVGRLRRIARFHGSSPTFITCSATIANPVDLAERLVGLPFELVSEAGSPTGEHHLVAYNPPVVNRQLQIRQGVVHGTVAAARALLIAGVSTIVFAGSRLHVELILKYLREALVREHLDPDQVQGYRGGYLPLHRRKIERGLRAGTVRGVVATNALEMGVDIGSLDACVIAGYPGSIASFRQQAGRAGRRAGRSLSVFVAGSGALDQYFAHRPERLVEASVETARINPKNLFVLVDHAKCAAFEVPFETDEAFSVLTSSETSEVLTYLEQHQVLHKGGERWHWSDRSFPANHVNLRGVPEQNFVVIDLDTDKLLAEVDFRSTHTTLHQHAIYHVDSLHYQVERLDYDDHKAFVRKVKPDYYTTAMTYTRVAIIQEDDSRPTGAISPAAAVAGSAVSPAAAVAGSAISPAAAVAGSAVSPAAAVAGSAVSPAAAVAGSAVSPAAAGMFTLMSGEVLVTRKFVGFKKVRFHTNEVIGYGEIHLPELEMHTTACWFDVPRALMDALPWDRDTLIDALEVVAHALRTVACAILMCHERDIDRAVGDRTGEKVSRPNGPGGAGGTGALRDFDPTVFLYDALPGGVGLGPEIFQRFDEIARGAVDVVAGCRCETGCPSCSGPLPRYHVGLRGAAQRLLGLLQGGALS